MVARRPNGDALPGGCAAGSTTGAFSSPAPGMEPEGQTFVWQGVLNRSLPGTSQSRAAGKRYPLLNDCFSTNTTYDTPQPPCTSELWTHLGLIIWCVTSRENMNVPYPFLQLAKARSYT